MAKAGEEIIQEINRLISEGRKEKCNDVALFTAASLLTRNNYIEDPLYISDVRCEMYGDSLIMVSLYAFEEHEFAILFENPPNPDVYIVKIR